MPDWLVPTLFAIGGALLLIALGAVLVKYQTARNAVWHIVGALVMAAATYITAHPETEEQLTELLDGLYADLVHHYPEIGGFLSRDMWHLIAHQLADLMERAFQTPPPPETRALFAAGDTPRPRFVPLPPPKT